MRQLIWGKTFLRAFKRQTRKYPQLNDDVPATLELLVEDPFDPRLATHKLKGKLAGSWACTVSYDMRIVFDFVESEGDESDIFLTEIGTHDEVY